MWTARGPWLATVRHDCADPGGADARHRVSDADSGRPAKFVALEPYGRRPEAVLATVGCDFGALPRAAANAGKHGFRVRKVRKVGKVLGVMTCPPFLTFLTFLAVVRLKK